MQHEALIRFQDLPLTRAIRWTVLVTVTTLRQLKGFLEMPTEDMQRCSPPCALGVHKEFAMLVASFLGIQMPLPMQWESLGKSLAHTDLPSISLCA